MFHPVKSNRIKSFSSIRWTRWWIEKTIRPNVFFSVLTYFIYAWERYLWFEDDTSDAEVKVCWNMSLDLNSYKVSSRLIARQVTLKRVFIFLVFLCRLSTSDWSLLLVWDLSLPFCYETFIFNDIVCDASMLYLLEYTQWTRLDKQKEMCFSKTGHRSKWDFSVKKHSHVKSESVLKRREKITHGSQDLCYYRDYWLLDASKYHNDNSHLLRKRLILANIAHAIARQILNFKLF